MNLATRASRGVRRAGDRGFAMAALLAAMAVTAILMTTALPTWKQLMQREREDELIFRGEQYARAIGAYQRKYANASPPSLDILVEQHFLRKKFKDPLAVTKDGEFALIRVSSTQQQGRGGQAGTLGSTSSSATGPIIGVVSTNPGQALRTYKDHDHYNEWQFMALQQSTSGGSTGSGNGAGSGAFDLSSGLRGGSNRRGADGQTGGRQDGRGQRRFESDDNGTTRPALSEGRGTPRGQSGGVRPTPSQGR